ncbi:LysR family transcriptional regulator [Halovibrio salipaludis]|uniref:LysR family transcriptional regulator n=1 Tax=Halovibrio salipaludis TaxID=2032626 RepID=A0A2A2F1Z0_9GAMM|nr:LysR family transcriptional regulator [Halovibrio salipaludis]PAU78645.1 LysR family transcriptional regulator [Halovibrio salipaludis]
MTNIPIDFLRTFVTIKDLGGFTHAGELLGRSQPAISLQIKKLESTLGTNIFSRGSNLELTEDGEYLYEAAQQILQINDQVVARIKGENVSGRVRLGIPNDFELAFLPRALRELSNIYPNITVEVDSDVSKSIHQRFQRNYYDVCLVMEPEGGAAPLDEQDQRVDQLAWVVNDPSVAEADIVPLVTYPQGCIYRAMMETALEEAGVPYRIAYTSPSLLGIMSAVEEGLGVTALAASVVPANVRAHEQTEVLPPLGAVSVSLYYRQNELNVATQQVLDFLRSGLAELSPVPALGGR